MAVSTLYFYQAALKAGPGKMKFEVISMMVTGIATVLYMTMFSGAGKSFVKELGHDINPHDTRDAFYWGRYVDWILTTPLMLWDVLALAGAPSDRCILLGTICRLDLDHSSYALGCIGSCRSTI